MIFLSCLMVAGTIKENLGDAAGFLSGGVSRRVNDGGAHLIDRVTRVRDGDTIVVGLIPIRISALDCDEAGSVAGDRATGRMRGIVRGQTLTCKLEGRRSYDREVGSCVMPDGHDIAELMIRDGYCARWWGREQSATAARQA